MTRNLIIDTDVALGVHHEGRPRDIDDGFAIAEAINSPDLNLALISCVFGNGPLDEVERVALDIIHNKQTPLPVARGAAGPMRSEDGRENPTNLAVESMASLLYEAPHTVAAIGPLTNMGLLALHHPQAYANIDTLLIVAGRTPGNQFYLGDAGPVQDFNFENDVIATRLALQQANEQTTIVMAGFELTSQVCVTASDLEAIKARGTPTASYFYENSLAWCTYWTDTFPQDSGFHPWDSATIAYLKHPEYFVTEARGWRIVEADTPLLECSTEFAGQSVQYCTGFTEGGAEAFVRDVVTSVY